MSNSSFAVSDGARVIETAKKLIKTLNNTGIQMDPRIFIIKKMKPEEMKFKLDVLDIPYHELKLKNKILVPKEDLTKCYELEQEYKTRGNFLQEFDTKELEKIISVHPDISNKNMLVIKNMNPAETELFLKKCNRIKKGMLVETQMTPDRKYNINIPEGLLSNAEKEKILLAYTETEIGITGINSPAKVQKKIEPTKENYYSAVKEHRFINSLCHAVSDKLRTSGLSSNSFGDYFKSFKLQLSHTAEQLAKGEAITGFKDNEKNVLLQSFQSLPEGTYGYTPSYINAHAFTSRPAMAETVEANMERTPSQAREVH